MSLQEALSIANLYAFKYLCRKSPMHQMSSQEGPLKHCTFTTPLHIYEGKMRTAADVLQEGPLSIAYYTASIST